MGADSSLHRWWSWSLQGTWCVKFQYHPCKRLAMPSVPFDSPAYMNELLNVPLRHLGVSSHRNRRGDLRKPYYDLGMIEYIGHEIAPAKIILGLPEDLS